MLVPVGFWKYCAFTCAWFSHVAPECLKFRTPVYVLIARFSADSKDVLAAESPKVVVFANGDARVKCVQLGCVQ